MLVLISRGSGAPASTARTPSEVETTTRRSAHDLRDRRDDTRIELRSRVCLEFGDGLGDGIASR